MANANEPTGYETQLAVVGLTQWKTDNGSTYYWVTNRAVSSDAINPDTDTEAYLLVVTGDTVKAYIIGGKGESEEQFSSTSDMLNWFGDKDYNVVYVDEDIVNRFKQYENDPVNGWAYTLASSLIGTMVLMKDDEVIRIPYVTVNDFLGISGLKGYYSTSDGNWYFIKRTDSFNGWELLPVETYNGVSYVKAGRTLSGVVTDNGIINITFDEDVFFTYSYTKTANIPDEYEDGVMLGHYDDKGNDHFTVSTRKIYLNEYSINVFYTRARAASLLIEATDPDDANTGYTVGFFESDSDESYALIDGPVNDLPIKKTALPQNDYVTGQGYRIHDYLYVSDSGKVLMLVDADANGASEFNAVFDGKTYESGYLKIANADAKINLYSGKNETIQPQFTLKKGQNVTLERLTDVVAKDVQERYWYFNGTNWNQATTVTNGTQTLIQYGGETYLTIETIDGVLYYTLPNGIRVGSDGSVVLPGKSSSTQMLTEVSGMTYPLGTLAGREVIVTMPDQAGSLVDGRTDAQTAPNIAADEDVTLVTASTGSIGTQEKPLDIVAGGDIIFKNLLGGTELNTDAFIEVSDGDIVIEPDTVVRDVLLSVDAKNGSIKLTDITVISEDDGDDNDGVLKMAASRDIVQLNPMVPTHLTGLVLVGDENSLAYADLTAGGTITLDQLDATRAKATIEAGGKMDIPQVEAKNDSEISLTAGGDITSEDMTAHNSTVTGKADGSITADEVEASDSELSLSAGEDITSKTVTVKDSTLTAEADGSITADEVEASDSEISLSAGKEMAIPEIELNSSKLNAQAGQDIMFDMIEGADSSVALRSQNGSILTEDAEGYIRLTGSSALTLAAGEDIGRRDARLMVDVPETLTVRIETVRNLYLDGVLLEGGAFKGERPQEDIRSGRNENGMTVSGDWILGAGAETIQPMLAYQTPEELAAWIASCMTREAWQTMITAKSLATQVEGGLIDAETLQGILINDADFSLKDLDELMQAGDYAALGDMLADALTGTKQDPENAAVIPMVSDEMATAWLGNAIAQGDVVDLGSTLTSILTQEEILALIEEAWNLADYDGMSETKPSDPEARALNLSIGVSTGMSGIWNEGSINITQDEGDFTAEEIRSERGDVSIASMGGDILGVEDETTDVSGRKIKLTAQGSIGDETHALETDQRTNRLELVGNITEPVKDENGNYNIKLVERAAVDEAGNPMTQWVLDVAVQYDWLRVDDPQEETRLDAEAGEDIFIREAAGNAGLGSVQAGGDVRLEAPGTILDVCEDAETSQNITAGGNAELTSGTGAIGDRDGYITIDVTGRVTARAQGDICLSDAADLDLIADSAEGQINADAAGNLNLSNADQADMVIGPVHAQGDVVIVSNGSILAGDRLGREAHVVGDSIALEALNGSVGTQDAPILVDTDADNGGTLTIRATGTADVKEISGDLVIGKVETGSDTTIAAPGSITDADDSQKVVSAADAERAAAEARSKAELAQTAADVLNAYAGDAGRLPEELGRSAAEKAVEQAQAAMNQQQIRLDELNQKLAALLLNPEATKQQIDALTKQIAAQQDTVDALQITLDERQARLDEINRLIDLAKQDAQALQQEADRLRSVADVLAEEARAALERAEGSEDSIVTGGNLTLTAGGSIGTDGNALGVNADGTLSVQVGDAFADGVDIESTGSVRFDAIEAEHVRIDALGDILAAGDGERDIQANDLVIRSVTGDVGQSDRPIRTSVDSLTAMGGEIHIENDRSLILDSVIGQTVELDVNGDVISGSGDPNVIADRLDIRADGNIGTAEDRLDIDADVIVLEGKDIFIHNDSGHLLVEKIAGDRIDIETEGSVSGGPIHGNRLDISAKGDVGSKENPLIVDISGKVTVHSEYGRTYWKNIRPIPAAEKADQDYMERTLEDEATGVIVHGLKIHRKAELTVQNLMGLNTEDARALCALIRAAMESDASVCALRIALSAPKDVPAWLGMLDVSIPVGAACEGKPLLVLSCSGDQVHALYGGVAVEGMLTFSTARLGDFVVLDPSCFEAVFALLRGTINNSLSQQMEVSEEALRILEEAYRIFREQADQTARLHLLHADTGTRLSVELASEELLDETGDVRLIVERVEDGEQTQDEAAGQLPVRASVRLVKSIWTDGVETLEAVSIDGACELTLSVDVNAGSLIAVECRMTDGSTESFECAVDENGDVTLPLSAVPVQVDIRLREAV